MEVAETQRMLDGLDLVAALRHEDFVQSQREDLRLQLLDVGYQLLEALLLEGLNAKQVVRLEVDELCVQDSLADGEGLSELFAEPPEAFVAEVLYVVHGFKLEVVVGAALHFLEDACT